MHHKALIIAHRGASNFAPENTIAAFQLAKEMGASWIECDVALTIDNFPVIIHDDTVNRTTNGHGKVHLLPLNKIQELDAGAWFDRRFINQRIPRLEEVLELIVKNKMFLNLEIKKVSKSKVPNIVDKVLETLKAYDCSSKILLSSFQIESLIYLSQIAPEYARAYLVQRMTEKSIKRALDCGCQKISMSNKYFNEKLVERCHTLGLKIGVYTVNDKNHFDYLQSVGVDMIFSDDLTIAN